jgi:hypothetical protein
MVRVAMSRRSWSYCAHCGFDGSCSTAQRLKAARVVRLAGDQQQRPAVRILASTVGRTVGHTVWTWTAAATFLTIGEQQGY